MAEIPRRSYMKRALVLGVLLAVAGLSIVAAGYQGPPPGAQGQGARGGGPGGAGGRGATAALQTIKVRVNLYMIANGGGNTAVFITTTGVVLVDTKNPNNGQGIPD